MKYGGCYIKFENNKKRYYIVNDLMALLEESWNIRKSKMSMIIFHDVLQF